MNKKTVAKPLSIALGAAFIGSLAGTTAANAADNPFSMTTLSSGYMVGEMEEGKCGGEKKAAEEAKCGAAKKAAEEAKAHEGKCGGEKKAAEEAKPAEGKCGGAKKK
jgi:uncharacterized low-complexity protein